MRMLHMLICWSRTATAAFSYHVFNFVHKTRLVIFRFVRKLKMLAHGLQCQYSELREFVKSDVLTQVVPIVHDGVDQAHLITDKINLLVSALVVKIFNLIISFIIIAVIIISLDSLDGMRCTASFSA